MNIIISNQKLDLTVVVREIFAICFGPIRGANLAFLVSGLFSLTLDRFCVFFLTLRDQ